MSRPLVLGDVMVDVVARLSGPLAPGSDSHAVIRFHGGGSAANTAAWLAHGRYRAAAGGPRGRRRARRRRVRDELRAAGVEVALAVDPELPTGTCIVLVGADGERTMAPDAGANDGLAETDLPDELLASAAHLHVAGYALAQVRIAARRPRGDLASARARAERLGGSVVGRPALAGVPRPRPRRGIAAAERGGGTDAQRRARSRERRPSAGGTLQRGGGHARRGRGALDRRSPERALRRGRRWRPWWTAPAPATRSPRGCWRRVWRMRRPRRRWRRARGWPLRRWAGRVGGLSRGRGAGVYCSGEGVVFRRPSCFTGTYRSPRQDGRLL